MVTLRRARGAVVPALCGPAAAGLLTAALAGCSAASGPASSAAAGSGTPPSASPATPAPKTPATPSTRTRTPRTPRTATPAPAATRTVYAGPARTSTLVPWDEPSSPVTATGPTPSAPAGTADLTVVLDDGFGIRATWTLTCGPAGGSHPAPKVACGVLGANGARSFAATPSANCADQFGGPQKALVTGTWRGTAVRSQFTLENSCEIRRWTAMIGLLPPGGV